MNIEPRSLRGLMLALRGLMLIGNIKDKIVNTSPFVLSPLRERPNTNLASGFGLSERRNGL